MRCTCEQQRVLPAGRLAFGAVGHHDRAAARGPGDRPPFGCHGEPRPTVADEPARFELVDQPVRLGTEVAPPVEMGPQPRVRGTAAGEPVQQAGGRPRRGRGVVTEGEAHCAALPESWPVSVPAPGSSDRFMVRLSEPVGPVDSAPMVEPSRAVT